MNKEAEKALFLNKIAANGDGFQKEASEAITDYTRETLRDEGILRKIIPAETVTDADMDEILDSDKPSKIYYKEVQTPLSTCVPLGTLPNSQYMNFKKYRVDFDRILTPNFVGDVRQINNYGVDVRSIYKEHAIKDMMTAEDVPFMQMVQAAVSPNGSPDMTTWTGNLPSAMTGKVQFYDFSVASGNPLGATGFTRDTAIEALKILPRGFGDPRVATPIRNKVDKVLMNVNTLSEYAKFDRTMAGGDISQEWLKGGFTEGNIHGVHHIGTLKDDIIPDGYAFYFAAPEALGKFLELESPTLFMETRAYMMEFFLYSMVGATIANPYGLSICKFF